MRNEKWLAKNTRSLEDKRVVISGSTGGIGRELCMYFAGLGASLVLLDRNMKKSSALADDIRAKYPKTSIDHLTADMSDISSVKAATQKLLDMNIDYVILNAGAYSIPRYTCDIGYDNVYTINFISPYYIARTLLPSVSERGGKIIAVGSIAHNYSKIDPADVDFSTRKKASLIYGNAKRYLTYSLLSLSEANVAVAHPGITFTGITSHYPKLIFALIKHPMKIIFMKPAKAALSIIKVVFAESKKNQWTGPRFFDIWGLPSTKKLNTANQREIAEICSVAEKIYNKIK